MLCNDKITLVKAKLQEINHIVVHNGRAENMILVENRFKVDFPIKNITVKWLKPG